MVAGRSGAEKQVASPFGRLKTIGAAHGITGCAMAERAARDVARFTGTTQFTGTDGSS